MAIIVDTGLLYAAADRRDSWHHRAIEFFKSAKEPLLVPFAVLPEACYLMQSRLGLAQQEALLASLVSGNLELVENTKADLARAAEIGRQYRDLSLDFADVVIVACAERLKLARIATTDRRDFSLIRPLHCERFDLLP